MSRQSRRGTSAVTVLLSLGVTLGFTALTVDLGTAMLARAQVQNAVDAGVLGGVAYFDTTSSGMSTAISRAQTLVASNTALGSPITVKTVEVGEVDKATGYTFKVTSDPKVANALRINGAELGVATPFGALLGRADLNPKAVAVAVGGAPTGAGSEDCYLPLAVPDCILDNLSTYEAKGYRLNSANLDNTGWATLPPQTANASNVKQQIEATNFCGALGLAQAGHLVNLNNGELTTALSSIASAVSASGTTWDSSAWGALPQPRMTGSAIPAAQYGRVIQGPIILFHDDSGGVCASATQFNQSKKITGFVWGVIYDVSTTGSNKNIRMKLDLTHKYNVGNSGGGIGNVTFTQPPTLVQ
jgi:Flp pilus assembly protein TadG